MGAFHATTRERVWVEVDLNHLAHNIQALKNKVGSTVKLIPMLKANAYGCGAAVVGKVALASGADWLGVELVEEALELRRAGISAPILAAGPSEAWQAEPAVFYDLRLTVRDEETLDAIAACADAAQKVALVHVELDTGLHRLGLQPEEALALIQKIENTTGVRLEGVWTHFAASDAAAPDFTRLQFQRYQSFLDLLAAKGIQVPIRHVANSAALIQYPEMRLDMARCGETVYGLMPRRDLFQLLDLKAVVAWKTRLIRIHPVAAGESVGYGQTWRAKRHSRIGTIPIGYADGYRRSFSNRAFTLVRGKRAPLVGRISMQMAMIDLTDVPDAALNDEVVLMGEQGGDCLSAYDLAAWGDTAEFEILVGISPRLPRHYLGWASQPLEGEALIQPVKH